MTDIKPRYVDGEPVCNRYCEHYLVNNHHCTAGGGWHCFPEFDTPCIPALRHQRDEARATAARLMEEAERYKSERDEARREICELAAMAAQDDECLPLAPGGAAKMRGWDCFGED